MFKRSGIALIGCGYVADSYVQSLAGHLDRLELVSVYDRNPERINRFTRYWRVPAAGSLEALLADSAISIVVNLTDPASHGEVTQLALGAGKHVYSEKPLAMTHGEARALADLAARHGVRLAAAPCNVLGEQAQILWRAVREGLAGDVRLIYAEMDDGMIHRAPYREWRNPSGAPWPARGEFEVGCTFEHAGYLLGVLVAIFGPVRRVTATACLCIADKMTDPPLTDPAPDFSTGCLEFDGGVVARVTNSVVATYDHRLRLFGTEGILTVDEPWSYAAPVKFHPVGTTRMIRLMERHVGWRPGKRLRLPQGAAPVGRGRGPSMDFMRGVRELAEAVRENRPCRLSPELAVHVTEVTEVLQHPERVSLPYIVKSSPQPMAPMEWAS